MADDDDDKLDDTDTHTDSDDHDIPSTPVVKEGHEEEDQFVDPIASPGVTGEESSAGDAPSGEPHDIDQALADLGLDNDEDGVKPLSSDDLEE